MIQDAQRTVHSSLKWRAMSLWNITWSRLNLPFFFGGVRYPFNIKLQKGSYSKPFMSNSHLSPSVFRMFEPFSISTIFATGPAASSCRLVFTPAASAKKGLERETRPIYWYQTSSLQKILEMLARANHLCSHSVCSTYFIHISPLSVGIPKILYIIYSIYKQIYTHIITYTIRMK